MEQKSLGFCDTCRVPQGQKPEQIRIVQVLSEEWGSGIFYNLDRNIFGIRTSFSVHQEKATASGIY